jgi:hypothetical protein
MPGPLKLRHEYSDPQKTNPQDCCGAQLRISPYKPEGESDIALPFWQLFQPQA